MRALTLTDSGPSLRTDWPVPIPPDGDILVRVVRAGICDTDLQLIGGYMGFAGVLGHEFVGIAEAGPFAGRRVRAADRADTGASTWHDRVEDNGGGP